MREILGVDQWVDQWVDLWVDLWGLLLVLSTIIPMDHMGCMVELHHNFLEEFHNLSPLLP